MRPTSDTIALAMLIAQGARRVVAFAIVTVTLRHVLRAVNQNAQEFWCDQEHRGGGGVRETPRLLWVFPGLRAATGGAGIIAS